jgi:hypothetical protein
MATHIVVFPDQKVAVAVLCNMDSVAMGGLATVNPEDLAKGVADVFLEDILEPRAAPAASAPPPASVSLSADELAAKTGLYRLGPDENHIVLMSVRDGRLTVRDFYGDNYDIVMTPISANRFLVPRHGRVRAGRSRAASSVARDRRRRTAVAGASVDEV